MARISTLNDGIDVQLVIPQVAAPTPSTTGTPGPLPPVETDRALPRTGTDVALALLLALLLITLGVALVLAGQRRLSRRSS